ncbi:kinase-like domain-containing protein [Lineolata rhizophorae]|uniref:Kinase-like domain-containing protein n=1 Tax=Lineolata rhizophorae TaxID=578093 RepID=A0A6A6NM74_9PEZI|nr:kinase-like domain-containing protein [Lineolata rhizophorae]
MPLSTQPQRELLMVGMSAKTYRIGNTVRKECHILGNDKGITEQNIEACKMEADVYLILGSHPLITKCLSIGLEKEYIELEYYPNGNLKEYIREHWASITETNLKRWTYQMIRSVAYIHSKGVRHSDLRLDQWLLDACLNARLSDFNASGFDNQPDLGLKGRPAQGLEAPSHCLPRDAGADNTVKSDLFALGSSLYELVAGQTPYEGLSNEFIESLFEKGKFPSTEGLPLRDIIMGCWKAKFSSAKDILDYGKNVFRSKETKETYETREK